jgi:hypothetical protein
MCLISLIGFSVLPCFLLVAVLVHLCTCNQEYKPGYFTLGVHVTLYFLTWGCGVKLGHFGFSFSFSQKEQTMQRSPKLRVINMPRKTTSRNTTTSFTRGQQGLHILYNIWKKVSDVGLFHFSAVLRVKNIELHEEYCLETLCSGESSQSLDQEQKLSRLLI